MTKKTRDPNKSADATDETVALDNPKQPDGFDPQAMLRRIAATPFQSGKAKPPPPAAPPEEVHAAGTGTVALSGDAADQAGVQPAMPFAGQAAPAQPASPPPAAPPPAAPAPPPAPASPVASPACSTGPYGRGSPNRNGWPTPPAPLASPAAAPPDEAEAAAAAPVPPYRRTGQAAHVLAGALEALVQAPDEDLSAFRSQHLGPTSELDVDDLRRLRDVLHALAHAIDEGREADRERLKGAWELLWNGPRSE